MQIDKKDFEKLMPKAEIPLSKLKIKDMSKYMYWHTKEDQLINKMKEFQHDKEKHINYMHQALLCELEKHEYDKINNKKFIMLLVMLKYHNARHDKKLFMDKHGRRVKKENDRRAIR